MAYKLKLPYLIRQLYPIFNVVKLSITLENLIPDHKLEEHSLPILINEEEEWKVEEILNSHWYQRQFQYLIKQKEYGHKHNSQKPTSEVSVSDLVVDFYCRHPEAPRYIYQTEFNAISLLQTCCFKMQQPQRGGKYKRTTLSHIPDTLVVVYQSNPALIK